MIIHKKHMTMCMDRCMYVHMYTYIYTCIRICVCICIGIHILIRICIRMHMLEVVWKRADRLASAWQWLMAEDRNDVSCN